MLRITTFARLPVAAALLVGLAACADQDPTGMTVPQLAVVVDGTDGASCSDLLAGQFTDAGDVCATVEGDNLVITYTTADGWELTEAHLWVGEHLADMPQTRKGNPKIGNFPYNSGDITGATMHQFSVPLSAFGLTGAETTCDDLSLIVAAHAALRKDNGDGTFQTETGWGDGDRFVDRGSWATYSGITLKCLEDVNPGGNTETAFAFGGADAACFLGVDEDGDGRGDFNRWGWTNGQLSAGSYTFDIYAGAGQCDLTKGTLVGTLTVDYDGSTATVTYSINGPYFLAETHLYVGNEILARNGNGDFTVAPGQYPTIHDPASGTKDEYTISGLSGDIYVVAHATVGGF
jgi:hypothetical protein